MNRRLPLVILSVAALVALPSTAATATGGHYGHTKPGYSSGYDKPKPGKHKPGKPKPAPAPTAAPGALCGGKRVNDVIAWDVYTCDKGTGYFLYKKLDLRKPAGYWNSGKQHRVGLYEGWAWPTADSSARKEATRSMPRDAQVIPLDLDATDTAAVCAERDAYGVQVDLVGDGVVGRGLDVLGLIPTTITPGHNSGGFPVPYTLAYYGHYEVQDIVDLDVLCAPPVVPPPAPEPTPEPTTEPTPEPTVEPAPEPTQPPAPEPTEPAEEEPAPTPEPSPSELSEVLPAPAETPSPTTPAPTPSPTPTERAEVLSAVEDDTLAATGTQAAIGLLAAIAAIAGGGALVLARRRHRTDS